MGSFILLFETDEAVNERGKGDKREINSSRRIRFRSVGALMPAGLEDDGAAEGTTFC